jgi:GNAT superfamily N-acetyltransferase
MATYDIVDLEPEHSERTIGLIRGILRDELQIARDAAADADLVDAAAVYGTDHSRFLIAMFDGQVVASGALRRQSDAECELRWLFAHKDHRREGLASMIFAQLLKWAQDHGYKRILLEIWPEMAPYTQVYRRYGFDPFEPGVATPRPGDWMTMAI